jgi:hypothetical protein
MENELEKSVSDFVSDEPKVEEAPVESAPPTVEPPAVPDPPIVEPPIEPPVTPLEGKPVEQSMSAPPPAQVPVQEPVADPKDMELATLRSTVEDLRKMIEQTAAQATMSKPAPVSAEPAASSVIKFIEKEEDLDKVLNSVDNFNAFMTTALQKGNEQILTTIPQIITKLADQVVTQRMAVAEFYGANKDLAGNKAFVGMVANDIAAKNPGWNMQQIIEKLGEEVRNRLRLSGVATQPPGAPVMQPPPSTPEAPAFVPGSGARQGAGGSSLTRMEKDIADMIADIM